MNYQDPGETELREDFMFILKHAREYAKYQGEADPDEYAFWYANQFGQDIMTTPAHSSVYWVFVRERQEGPVYSTTEACPQCGEVHPC